MIRLHNKPTPIKKLKITDLTMGNLYTFCYCEGGMVVGMAVRITDNVGLSFLVLNSEGCGDIPGKVWSANTCRFANGGYWIPYTGSVTIKN